MQHLDGDSGFPLGVLERADVGDVTLQLEPEDLLLLFTDGVTETASPSGAMLGYDGLERAFLKAAPGSAEAVLTGLKKALRRHAARKRPRDDRTLLLLRVL